MDIYRSPMEKALKQQENDTVITNPDEPGKTFLRKVAYVTSRWVDKLKRLFHRSGRDGGQA